MDELVRAGLARFEYQHILNHGLGSVIAALATECGGDQGRWWDFHDHYMTTPDFSRDGAVVYASTLDIDIDQFRQCLDDQVHLERIEAQHRQAASAGVRRTPTIRVNGEGAPVTAALIDHVRALAETLQ